MKKMKFFAIAALALLTSITSCNNEDINTDNPSNAKDKNIAIKMTNAPKSGQRSDSESGLSESAVLTTGVVIFVNGDAITRYVNLSTTGSTTYSTPDDNTVPSINIGTLSTSTGVKFQSVVADKVYIIGNRLASDLSGLPTQAADGSVPAGSKMSELLKANGSLLDVTDATDMNDGKHENVPLYGFGLLILDSGDDYKTTIELAPSVARLEIKEIFATNITFNVSGIFINNYYTKAQVDGTIAAGDEIKNNKDIPANYEQAYHATPLRDWSDDLLGNEDGDAIAGFSVKPTNVWGYNVFAAKNVNAGDKNMPHVVLRLSNVKNNEGEDVLNGSNLVTDKFITVTGFNVSGVPVTEFKKGYVYTINKITFSEANLTEQPEINDRVINATVDVTIRAWVDGGVITPEL